METARLNPAAWGILSSGLLLTLAVYGPRLGAPLIWDDRTVISFNAEIEHPIALADFFTSRYFSFSREYSWRPLSTLSYFALVRIFGRSPLPLRAFSLLLHILNGLLLLAILDAWGWRKETSAWAAALFWAHPAHVESLMCAAFNKEALAAFGLLSMLAAHRNKRPGLACAGLIFAALSKETGVLGPLLAVFHDLCGAGARRCRERLGAYLAYAAVVAAYSFLRFYRLLGPGAHVSMSLPPSERIYGALGGLIAAVRVFFIPLSLRIEYFALPPESAADWLARGGLGLGLLIILGGAARYLWKEDRKLAFFWLWPLPFLLVVSNLFPVGALNTRLMAERWLYIPYIGWTVVLASLLSELPARSSRVAAAAIMAGWGWAGFLRAQDWTRETRLWRGLEAVYPWSAKAEEGLGEAYFHERRYAEALAAFEKAGALRESRRDKVLEHYIPLSRGLLSRESPSLQRWLGHCEVKLGNLPKAEAAFEKALALDPGDGFSYRIMACSHAEAGDFVKARRWLRRGLARRPGDELLLRLEPEIERKKLRLHVSFD